MRTGALDYKPYTLINPQVSAAATINGSAQAITPGEEGDAIAVVQIGTVQGSPTSWSAVITILGSATSGGTYDTLATIGSVSLASTTTTGEIATAPVNVNTGKYAFIKSTAVITFTAGTTPSLSIGVALLQRQTVGSTSALGALA